MAVKYYYDFVEGKEKIDFFAGQHDYSEPSASAKTTTNKVIAAASFLIGKEISKAIAK